MDRRDGMYSPQMTKCSLVWKGFTAAAFYPALVKGKGGEMEKGGGKGDGEKGKGEEIKPRSSGKSFKVCSLKGGQDFTWASGPRPRRAPS